MGYDLNITMIWSPIVVAIIHPTLGAIVNSVSPELFSHFRIIQFDYRDGERFENLDGQVVMRRDFYFAKIWGGGHTPPLPPSLPWSMAHWRPVMIYIFFFEFRESGVFTVNTDFWAGISRTTVFKLNPILGWVIIKNLYPVIIVGVLFGIIFGSLKNPLRNPLN